MAKDKRPVWARWELMALAFLAVAALIIASGYMAYTAISGDQKPAGSPLRVRPGYNVSVDYIGMFEDGRVFDTSIKSVADNDALYPKSLSFTPRASYSPMEFTVGSGQMIKGFDDAVVDMALNETKLVVIPPEDGYGSPDGSLIRTYDLEESFPVFHWLPNSTAFSDRYSVPPLLGTTVRSTDYGWNMTVYYIDPVSGDILMKDEPFIGEVVSIHEGWMSKVVSVDSAADNGTGRILLRHMLTPDDAGRISGQDRNGQYILTAVDPDAGTYTLDYNREVVGKTLIFKITVVSITPNDG